VWLAAIDLERRLVPNRIVLGSLVAVLAAVFAVDPATGAVHALAAVLAGASFLAAALVRPGALGIGDVKLVALLGALLGAGVLGALTVGFLFLGIAALALVVRDGRSALARQLPLVPFLAAGAIATLLAG
jgi:prepilin signal peptidase PulO-like enzyme (type II secretory pathway)